MRTLFCLVACSAVVGGVLDEEEMLKRGDANHSGVVNISDASYLSSYLYSGGAAPPCMNEADVNGDGVVNGSDVTYLTNWLFNGGSAPPAPGPFNNTCASASKPISCHSGC